MQLYDDGPTRHALVKGENVMRFAGPPAANRPTARNHTYVTGHDFPQLYDHVPSYFGSGSHYLTPLTTQI